MNQDQVAIYARVSSDQQAEAGTINSQIAALLERVEKDGYHLRDELRFIDDGYSGTTLVRPALERLRDGVAMGEVERLYVHSPDRLARKYAYQALLVDEFQRAGIEIVFVNHALGESAEDQLLLQVQGMIAEYEHAKIIERNRRGKRHAAQAGKVAVLSGAPYGYHYVTKAEGGGEARYEIIPEQAQVVRQIFQWVGIERVSMSEICRRLEQIGAETRGGITTWDRSVVWGMLRNPAYKGMAAFGKTNSGPMRPRLRPHRQGQMHPRQPVSIYETAEDERIYIPVPALIDPALFDAVQEQLAENRQLARQRKRGARYLLQGLLVCAHCGYAYCGRRQRQTLKDGSERVRTYYRCIGNDRHRCGGDRACHTPLIRTELLDQLVWHEVQQLLANGHRLRQEYERRLHTPSRNNENLAAKQAQMTRVRQGISRLIDSYRDGFIQKDEFEPRISRLRQRLTRLETEEQKMMDHISSQQELDLVIRSLEGFAVKVKDGLLEADWQARRNLIRILVKRVELSKEDVHVVFRIPPNLAELDPNDESLQYCWRGVNSSTTILRLIAHSFFQFG